MVWFVRARRGISWQDQTLASISAPPSPLMVFFGLLITLVYFATHSGYKERVERRRTGFRFGLLLLPVVVILGVNMVMLRRRMLRYSFGVPKTVVAAAEKEGSSAAALLLVVVVLLVMVHYQSSFQSSWFRFV
ncbi:hypothetical protein Salat_0624900 [Sesamum alatum]|uniref:Uncharacterized protein n=1 Tax=Sesamum alatum TaxID=300844 RepID=A0AAE1YQN9_9LAMI|nr:hypothetical protein Salat_0624900 [Sesamum alatum]